MPAPRVDFLSFLASIRKGRFVEQCGRMSEELTKAMFEHDGDGELQITLKFKAKGDGQLVITPRCKIKKPTEAVGEAIFYATVDGELEREDPKQGSLQLEGKVRPLRGGGEREDD